MIDLCWHVSASLLSTLQNVAPIVLVIVAFQVFVLRRGIPQWRRAAAGFAFVIAGLALFLVGLELALFPLGTAMAEQLADPRFLDPRGGAGGGQPVPWFRYYWAYLFAFAMAFSATLAEPALLAVATKAREVSGGALHIWSLRVAVAIGSGVGVMLGALRIVIGVPLPYFIFAGYGIIVVQTFFAPRQIVPLAYDSGGVTTSTVTVPLVAALGLGLATQIPGRDPLAEGFGMIALAVMFPMMSVMGYAQLAHWWNTRPASSPRRAA